MIRELCKTSPHGLGFRMLMDQQDGTYSIRTQALGLDILVCEVPDPREAARRWANTYNDLTDLQRLAERMIERGNPSDLVARALQRAAIGKRIPHLNYIG